MWHNLECFFLKTTAVEQKLSVVILIVVGATEEAKADEVRSSIFVLVNSGDVRIWS